MMKKQILTTIETHNLIDRNAHIVMGLSGGPDSVCLFHVLCQLAEERNWTIHPVHVNHQLRPGDAEADQAYVEALCQAQGWPCETFVYDCSAIAAEEKITCEEAGRNLRYGAFAQTAKNLRSKGIPQKDIVIAVAQNADDQAETILFRMLRGAGTDGLAGIAYKRFDEEGNRIVRPLLDCWKADILQYCQNQNLQPQTDKTNLEPVYTRNKIRLELIPYLEREYNPAIQETMIRMGKACAGDRDFLRQTAKSHYELLVKEQAADQILLDGKGLKALHPSIRQRVLSMAFQAVGLSENLTYGHFEQCEEIVFHDHPSARTDLPGGYVLTRNYDDIKICSSQRDSVKQKLCLWTGSMDVYRQMQFEKDQYAVFDADAMAAYYGEDYQQRICLRSRQAGDTIAIGQGKRKKLQDYFVDRKIPKDQRDSLQVVKIGHDVLWVPPYGGKGRFCSHFKLCSDTKNVICIEIICVLC